MGVNVGLPLLRILYGVASAVKLRSSKYLKGKKKFVDRGRGKAQYSSVQKVPQ
jgi:hypothetical protein